jgi:hypothetical protein
MDDPYFSVAWWYYLAFSGLFVIVWWWSFRHVRPCWFCWLLVTAPVAALFTPMYGDTTAEYFVPAVIVAGFEMLGKNWDLFGDALKRIVLVWSLLVVFASLICWMHERRQTKITGEENG